MKAVLQPVCPRLTTWWNSSGLFLEALNTTYWTLDQLLDKFLEHHSLQASTSVSKQKGGSLYLTVLLGIQQTSFDFLLHTRLQVATVDKTHALPLTKENSSHGS